MKSQNTNITSDRIIWYEKRAKEIRFNHSLPYGVAKNMLIELRNDFIKEVTS